jgi:hypothetical protein
MSVRDDSVHEQIMQAGGRPLRVAIRPVGYQKSV